MKKLGLLLIILLIGIAGWGQSITKKDSLLKLLPKAKEDTAKVLLYIDIGNLYELDSPQTAEKYYLMAGNLSKRLGYKRGIIKYISNYTAILNEKGGFEKSLVLNKQAFQIARDIKDKLYIAKTAANIGNNFNYLNESDSALYYYETAGRYFEEIGSNYLLARMYEMEQLVYQNMGRYKKALQYGKMAVKELRASKDSVDLGRSLLNLANSYQSNYFPDSAMNYYKEALAISQK
ncbi:tetratricopeptide repeat protein [Pedobacter steynii]